MQGEPGLADHQRHQASAGNEEPPAQRQRGDGQHVRQNWKMHRQQEKDGAEDDGPPDIRILDDGISDRGRLRGSHVEHVRELSKSKREEGRRDGLFAGQ